MMRHQISKNGLIFKQPIMIDGLARTGKFLLGKLLSNFEQVEYFQYLPVIEQVPIHVYFENMNRQAGLSLMRTQLDLASYDRALGRNLNFRKADGSSILHATKLKMYEDRLSLTDDHQVFDDYVNSGMKPSFLLHECMPFLDYLFEVFPNMLFINAQRHPSDLAFSWFQRGWGRRHGVDPIAFVPAIEGKNKPMPWFASDWEKDYWDYSESERVLKNMISLYKKSYDAHDAHHAQHSQILELCYEDFFPMKPEVVNRIAQFIGGAPFDNMDEIIDREGCNRILDTTKRETRLQSLMADSSKATNEEFVELVGLYEKKWNQNE